MLTLLFPPVEMIGDDEAHFAGLRFKRCEVDFGRLFDCHALS